ncbi:hypothetical protein IJI72_02215 [Candidatus Saccharibacteria bacterium]|nr:hypothetical protein [Candidatus Saccharibacteria bacterium]
MSKRHSRGFTIIEVSLFLALSGFLMVGLIASANSSISRQRYNDSVNDVADFIRGLYAEVINTSLNRTDGGRSTTQAVYGKMIDFNRARTGSVSKIDVYTIVGTATNSSSDLLNANIKDVLDSTHLQANIMTTGSPTQIYEKQTHNLPWDTSIENADGTWAKGILLILRSPTSGTVYTYYYNTYPSSALNQNSFQQILTNASNTNDVDLCIDSPDNNYGVRRNLRIQANASGSSGVALVAQDSSDNRCGTGNSGNTPTS